MIMLHQRIWVPLLIAIMPWAAQGQLNANFTANATTGCNPTVIQFTNLSTGNPTSYLWDFGNGVTSTLANPSATYTSTGSFTVTLTVSNGSSSNTKTVTNYITIYPPPTVDFSVDDDAGCPPHSVGFTTNTTLNAPGSGTYVWNMGNGQNVTGQNPAYTFVASGLYNITHIVVNSVGCTTSHQKPAYINVFTPPVADFSTPNIILCGTGSNAIFANASTGTPPLSYQWDFGDGGTGTAANPSHAYSALGTYTVKLIVTDGNGCKDTLEKPNYIHVTPGVATFNVPSSACVNTPLVFQNTTPLTLYCNWNFGDGYTDTNQTTTHTYTTPGTYQVTMMANNGTCSPVAQQTIVIHPNPSVDFSADVLTPCPAPAPVQFTNLTQNGGTYTWDFGDGGTSTLTNPSHTYLNNGFYDVTLTATSPFGCVSSVIKPQYINIYDSHLSIEVAPGDGCIPVVDSFSATLSAFAPGTSTQIPYPATVTSYSWDFDDGTTSIQPEPIHTFANPGTYHVRLVVTTSNGCTDSAFIDVHTGTPPTPDFEGTPLVTCVDQPVYFQNNTTNALTYLWAFGDGGTSTDVHPVHEYELPGIYTVMLVANNNGCKDTLIKTDYIVVNDPKAQFEVQYQCDTFTKVQFLNISINATSCVWHFGDGTTSTQNNPTHTYPGTGSYQAMLIAYNSNTGCYDTATMQLDFQIPQLDFIASDTAVCPGNTITFSAMISDPAYIARYHWVFTNWTLPDTTAVLDWWLYAPGWHDVTLITEDIHGCLDTFTRYNYILVGHPQVNFVANDTTVCAPGSVTFTDMSMLPAGTTPASFEWDFGNGIVVNTPNPSYTVPYTFPGLFSVLLRVTDNLGCIDSGYRNQYISVTDPEPDFYVNNTNACVGAPITFLNTTLGSGNSFVWHFGDGNTSTSVNATHVYTATGTYTVSLVVTDANGCSDTLTKPSYIDVWGKPTAAFTLSDTFRICSPLLLQATNLSTGAIVNNWDFGDGGASTAVNPSHVYLTPGLHTVRLIAINGNGCRDTAYSYVHLLGYDGSLTYSPLLGCAPLTVTFEATVHNVPGFVWDFADGTTLVTTDSVVTHTYTTAGPKVPKLILTDNAGCSSSSQGLDTIKVDGVYAGFTHAPYPACESGTLDFLDTSRGAYSVVTSRMWLFHDGTTDTSATPSKYYPGVGDYIVQMFFETSSGCKDTLVDTVTFYPLPVIDAGLDTTICLGDSARLQPSGGVSYAWSPATSLSCANCTTPMAGPQTETMYIVTGTDASGCSNQDSVWVRVKTNADVITGEGGEICRGESLQLMASGASEYIWIPAAGLSNPNIPDPMASPSVTTVYMLIGIEGSCVPDTEYVEVIVHPLPDVDAGPDQTIIAGEAAQLQASGTGFIRYEWRPSETLNCADCMEPEARPKETTTYSFIAYNDFGCSDSDQVTIFVICKESQVFMPNSFTPNGDGQNDRFYPRGKGIQIINSFRIYNRWGELIFERKNLDVNNINSGWDGTYKGVELPPDVFVYIIDAVCDTGEPVSWKGDISLIR